MDEGERVAMQRVLAHEAMAKLNAIGEMFSAEEGANPGDQQANLLVWQMKIAAFEDWLWRESPIA